MIDIIPMNKKEYSYGGGNLAFRYSYANSPFGKIFILSTEIGVTQLSFIGDRDDPLSKIHNTYPNAKFKAMLDSSQQEALSIFSGENCSDKITLHLNGTDFQLKIWSMLINIPRGELISYRDLAIMAGHPKAFRAVGSAVGQNPVAVILPCHRVIRSSGILGNYAYGEELKKRLIEWECRSRL